MYNIELYNNIYKGEIQESIYQVTKLILDNKNERNIELIENTFIAICAYIGTFISLYDIRLWIDAVEEVEDEDALPQEEAEGADRDELIQRLKVRVDLISIGVSRSTHETGESDLVHHVEGAVGEDERPDEVDLAQTLTHQTTEHLREPVMDRAINREHRTAEHHVVEVRDDDVSVVHIDVDGRRRHPDARQSTDDEERHERDRVQVGCRQLDPRTPESAEPVEDLDGRGERDQDR